MAIVYRFIQDKRKGLLPIESPEDVLRLGYQLIRHDISRCSSFGDFARALAKEYRDELRNRGSHRTQRENNLGNSYAMEPIYRRDVVEMYNGDEDAERKLSYSSLHHKIQFEGKYCALCSPSHWIKVQRN